MYTYHPPSSVHIIYRYTVAMASCIYTNHLSLSDEMINNPDYISCDNLVDKLTHS